jgi:hypothetical protein
MSLFIANLAFADPATRNQAKGRRARGLGGGRAGGHGLPPQPAAAAGGGGGGVIATFDATALQLASIGVTVCSEGGRRVQPAMLRVVVTDRTTGALLSRARLHGKLAAVANGRSGLVPGTMHLLGGDG